MSDLSQIEVAARSLKGSQRLMLLEIGDGQPREFVLGRTGFALIDHKLAFVNELGARHLTDLGHAVRAYLQGHPDA